MIKKFFIFVVLFTTNIFYSLGIRKSIKPIPDGKYCYVVDKENKKPIDGYWIIPCKYYKKVSENINGCNYLGIITSDIDFKDQCKICNK